MYGTGTVDSLLGPHKTAHIKTQTRADQVNAINTIRMLRPMWVLLISKGSILTVIWTMCCWNYMFKFFCLQPSFNNSRIIACGRSLRCNECICDFEITKRVLLFERYLLYLIISGTTATMLVVWYLFLVVDEIRYCLFIEPGVSMNWWSTYESIIGV